MFIFNMSGFRLALLIYFMLSKTISTVFLTRQNGNPTNNSYEEYVVAVNAAVEGGNYSLQDFNNTNNVVYETVVVRVASSVDVYFTPCLITLGIGGNMLALYVFYSSKLRHQSTSQYLSALAISDSLFLGELFPPWLGTMDINGVFHRDAFCKGFVYISYVTCCLSSWLVIAFTVERFIAVRYPLQRPAVCTVRRARYAIAVLTVASMLVNLPVLHFAGVENQHCHIDREKLEQAAKFNWVDTTVTFTIPLVLIIFFNTWIAAVLYRLERDRIKLTQEELRAAANDGHFVYLRSQRRITHMLLIVSTIFVLFNTPAYTLRVCGYAYDMDSSALDDKWLTAQNIATMMFNANFGINFFLYCLTGQNFRRALVQTVPCFGWLARNLNRIFQRNTPNNGRTCSVTTSAASTGTDATCADMSLARGGGPKRRRARRRSGSCIMRWTFDNSKQARVAAGAVSAASESIAMQELDPQPGPSRLAAPDPPPPGAFRDLMTVRTRAVIETRRADDERRWPARESRFPAFRARRLADPTDSPAIQPWRPPTYFGSHVADFTRTSTDFRGPAIDSRPTVVESRHPSVVTRQPTAGARRPPVVSRHLPSVSRQPNPAYRQSNDLERLSVLDMRDAIAESRACASARGSALVPLRPIIHTNTAPTRARVIRKRKSCCM